MPGQIRQSRISGLLEDEAMHDEFEEAWTEREEARKAVHDTLAGGSAFHALRKACKKLREINKNVCDFVSFFVFCFYFVFFLRYR